MADILGISAFYHDSAAALVRDGEIVAAAQEERFSRRKHDAGFPRAAIAYCLAEAGVEVSDLHAVVFYEKPLVKFERLLETYLAFAPRGLPSFLAAMPLWLREKLFLKDLIRRELERLGGAKGRPLPPVLFSEHHEAHAASAFYPSPFERAAILCVDGVGEWATTSAWVGRGDAITPLWEIPFPHSLGLLYAAFTAFAGFRVNSDEYKLMGLAPYGEPRYVQAIYDHLVDVKADGTFRLNLAYFDYCTGLKMTNRRFERLFGGPPRRPGGPITAREMDLARSIQVVTEEIMLRLAGALHRETGERCLCLAGGVALNCVANGRMLREGPYEALWIQPAAGDAGGAVGAALLAWYGLEGGRRRPAQPDGMRGARLGPAFDRREVEERLRAAGAVFTVVPDERLFDCIASDLAAGRVVGWFDGRMEFGPRALGGRSILADPRDLGMQALVNRKIKFRESFRPFAPAVLRERAAEYFELEVDSPYMLLTAPVRAAHRRPAPPEAAGLTGLDRLRIVQSSIPAVTHVDGSARIQTVEAATHPRFHRLLEAFERQTGCGVLLNTSFNVRDEPIVCTPEDAYACFMRTELDRLVIENCVLDKRDQPARETPAVVAASRPEPASPGGPGDDGGIHGPARNDDVVPALPALGPAAHAPAGSASLEAAGLRRFGLAASAFVLVAAVFIADGVWISAALLPAAALVAAAWRRPEVLAGCYRGWMRLARAVGRVNTVLLLTAFFFAALTPMAALLRLVRYDPMRRRPAPAASYRVAKSARRADHLYRQF
jgi:carbamoyltransferase